MKYLVFICILFVLPLNLYSQQGKELGVWLGLSQYFGDLNTNNKISSPGLAAGILGRHNFNNRISFAANIGIGRVSAADSTSTNSYQIKRNLSFRSRIFDVSGVFEFNFYPYIHGSYDHYFTPYIFGGLGFSKFNPQGKLGDEWYNLQEFGTEGQSFGDEYLTSSLSLVYGVGFKVDLNRDFSLNFALSGRRLMSDYLDDVSQQYPDLNELRNQRGTLAVQLADRSGDPDFASEGFQRGNQKDSDYYYFFSISLVKYFGEIKCPAISRIRE